MSTYAHVVNGVVVELPFTPPAGFTIAECFASGLTWVDCTATAGVTTGWTYAGGVFAAPVAPTLTLAQQAAAAMGAGLAITSTGTPALNATYDVSAPAQDHMQAEMIALLNSGGTAFADGTSSVVWPDMTGAAHTFSAAAAKAFFLAVGAYVAALFKVTNGTLTTLPAATATIA